VRSVLRYYNWDGLEKRVQGSVESEAVERKLGGWSEMAASLEISQLKHWENYKGICEDLVGAVNNEVSAEAEELPLLEAVIRKRQVKTKKTLCML
jgi:hypothetical protein